MSWQLLLILCWTAGSLQAQPELELPDRKPLLPLYQPFERC